LLHRITAEQWGRVRVMTLKWSKLMALSSGMFLSILWWLDLVEIWKTRYPFNCRTFAFYDWVDTIHGTYLCSHYCGAHVFWNQSVCRKEKAINWKRCRRRNLHGVRF